MTKNNRGGKRKGAGRPKLGRDKLLTVRLSPTTIDRLGPRPALTVRSVIEFIVGGDATSYDGDIIVFRGRSARKKTMTLQDAFSRTTNEGEQKGILQQLIEGQSTLFKKASANLVKD